MLFHTQNFIIFFLVVFTTYYLAGTDKNKRNILLISEVVFYMFWSIPLVLLLILSSLVDYYTGKKLWHGGKKNMALL
jgi:D-alanyl-lipoteichoic acid acyltransferase DltB (MBOAT superfamily)